MSTPSADLTSPSALKRYTFESQDFPMAPAGPEHAANFKRDTSKPLVGYNGPSPTASIRPPCRNPLTEAPVETWTPSIKTSPSRNQLSPPPTLSPSGRRLVERAYDPGRAGSSSERLDRTDRKIRRLEPKVDAQPKPRGKAKGAFAPADRNPMDEELPVPRAARRPAAVIRDEPQERREWSVNPEARHRRVLSPEKQVPATSLPPAFSDAPAEPPRRPSIRTATQIELTHGTVAPRRPNEGPFDYSGAPNMAAKQHEVFQPNPDKPTSGLPQPQSPKPPRRMKRPAPGSMNFLTSALTPEAPPSKDANSQIREEAARTRRLYEMQRTAQQRDHGRPY